MVVPRYRLSTKPFVVAAVVVFPLLTLLSRLPWFLLLMLVFLLLFAAVWYGRIRRIVFADAVRVQRVRGREQVFAYRDVRAITPTAIRMRRGGISLMEPLGQGTFINADEVTAAFRALIEAGVIAQDDLIPDEVLALERRRALRSLIPASILTVAITVVLVATGRLSGNGAIDRAIPLIILLLLFALFHLLQHLSE